MNIDMIKKYYWIPILILIFIISFEVRAIGIVPDKLLSYDPIFQYRHLRYIADYGTLPAWDELTYYTGREISTGLVSLFQYVITFWIYRIINVLTPMGLMTAAAYSAALYGALISVAAFLLVRELSNNEGGLLAAALVGTAPQILSRTFGASFDTDQLVVFFILFTLWLSIRMLKYKTPASIFFAFSGFFMFAMLWVMWTYPLILVGGVLVFYLLITYLFEHKLNFKANKIKNHIYKYKDEIIVFASLFVILFGVLLLFGTNLILSMLDLVGFATQAEKLIVNISIAELQNVSLLDLQTWILALGRIALGDAIVDTLALLFIFGCIAFAVYYSFKNKKLFEFSAILVLTIFTLYTLFRGIRFTEFTSAIFLSVAGVGFGYLIEFLKKDKLYLSLICGVGFFVAFVSIGIAFMMAPSLGPDMDKNWDSAWQFLKENTNELAIVGTWWDPGHMIAGLAERRNFADGAHCGSPACMYGINDRITDTGKIFATDNEDEAINLIRKYKGDSTEVYWIASSDLIGKFQWIQYFGTGCDARTDQRCPLYLPMQLQSVSQTKSGYSVFNYNNVKIILRGNEIIPILINNRNGALFSEIIVYENNTAIPYKISNVNTTEIENEMRVRMSSEQIPYTVLVMPDGQNIILIPPHLRNNIFTKMFFFDGQGLTRFKEVFSNSDVKIFKVVL